MQLDFLKNEFLPLLKRLDGTEKPLWGVMNAQQMIEHMSDSFRQGNGKSVHAVHTSAEQLPAYKKFLMSDKEFRPGTRNPILSETPAPVKKAGIPEAIQELETEVYDFITHFKTPGLLVTNPVFGDLNFEEWVQLLHKHAIHHLKQFGLVS